MVAPLFSIRRSTLKVPEGHPQAVRQTIRSSRQRHARVALLQLAHLRSTQLTDDCNLALHLHPAYCGQRAVRTPRRRAPHGTDQERTNEDLLCGLSGCSWDEKRPVSGAIVAAPFISDTFASSSG